MLPQNTQHQQPPAATSSFSQLISRMRAVSIPVQPSAVPGWLTPVEQQALYALAYILDGPFLEIGAWIGKSTSIIARAIRDAGRPKRFITSELNPTVANFRPVTGGMGFFLDPASNECLAIAPMVSWRNEIEPVLRHSGGVVGALRENLARLALERLVEISVGDFSGVPRLGYNFIFSDCMHTPHEIAAGLPTLRSILNGRGCILAAHDWSPENEAFLRRNLPIADAARFDSLFVCQVSEAA